MIFLCYFFFHLLLVTDIRRYRQEIKELKTSEVVDGFQASMLYILLLLTDSVSFDSTFPFKGNLGY